jgi:hypothetical protein
LCVRVSNRGLAPFVNHRGVLLVEEGSNNEDTM